MSYFAALFFTFEKGLTSYVRQSTHRPAVDGWNGCRVPRPWSVNTSQIVSSSITLVHVNRRIHSQPLARHNIVRDAATTSPSTSSASGALLLASYLAFELVISSSPSRILSMDNSYTSENSVRQFHLPVHPTRIILACLANAVVANDTDLPTINNVAAPTTQDQLLVYDEWHRGSTPQRDHPVAKQRAGRRYASTAARNEAAGRRIP